MKTVILTAFILGIVRTALGGLMFMFLVSALHDYISPSLHEVGYWGSVFIFVLIIALKACLDINRPDSD